jgi:polyisoprenoid-binding protein YceI
LLDCADLTGCRLEFAGIGFYAVTSKGLTKDVWNGWEQEEDRIVHATRALTEGTAVLYTIDTQKSAFFVQAFSTGLLSAFGHDPKIAIRDFQGEAEFTPGQELAGVQMRLSIRADSLEVMDDISDKDRQDIQQRLYREVLETDRFPEIVYDCSQVAGSGNADRYWLVLKGELSLRGITRSLPVSLRLVVNGDSLRASGECTLRQSEYGIAPVSAAAGTIRVKDELKCTFDIVATKHA